MKTDRKCRNPRETPSTPLRRWPLTEPMRSAGIFTAIPRLGCPAVFMTKRVKEGQRKFMGTLWNTYAFFVLYANIDEFDATKYQLEYEKLAVMDQLAAVKTQYADSGRRR